MGAWRVYAIFEKGQEIFEKSVYARRIEIRHFGACSLMACIRSFQDDEEVSTQ